jgi:formamidopyrimidine-DNA glycosylase
MPELPEVESFRRYVEETSLNQEISGVSFRNEHMLLNTSKAKLVKTLKGNKLAGTLRHGKYLFIRLAKGGHLLLHFGLTGDVAYVDEKDDEPRFTVLLLEFKKSGSFAFTDSRQMGKVGLVDDVNKFLRNKGWGPDALQVTKDEFIDRFESRRTNIKTALMNQKLVAGVGNEFSDEILFQCGLHPESRVDKLGRKGLENVYKQMVTILKKAVSVNADRDRLSQYFFPGNRKAGLECPRCGGKTEFKTVGGRSAYFCPSCQELVA